MARESFWYGLNEEEARKLDMGAFLKLIPAKERRSLKRGLSDAEKSFLKCLDRGDQSIKTHCRDMVVLPSMLGKKLLIHSGKEFVPVTISLEMLGHRLGEFALSRRSVSHSAPGIGATRSSAFASVK